MLGEHAQLAGEPLVGERPEAVEDRLQHDRRDKGEEGDGERECDRGGRGPVRGEPAREPDERGPEHSR